MKNYKVFGIFMVFAILFISIDADAQRRTRRARKSVDETTIPFNQKLWYGIRLGNLDFFNGNFSFSNKFSAGYKLNQQFSGGVAVKSFLDILGVNNGPDLNLFSYGFGAFTRFKVSQDIFLHVEYDVTSYDEFSFNTGNTTRETFTYPMIGGGYESGQGQWKYGLEVLYIANEQVRELNVKNSFVEWWLSFSYNF